MGGGLEQLFIFVMLDPRPALLADTVLVRSSSRKLGRVRGVSMASDLGRKGAELRGFSTSVVPDSRPSPVADVEKLKTGKGDDCNRGPPGCWGQRGIGGGGNGGSRAASTLSRHMPAEHSFV